MTAREAQVKRALRSRPVFERYEQVRFVPSDTALSPLRAYVEEHPDSPLYVVQTQHTWLAVLAPDHGRRFPREGTGMGTSYFRIVGPCGMHRPAWSPTTEESRSELASARRTGFSHLLAWRCLRCGADCPEAMSTYHLYYRNDRLAA